MMLKCVDGPGVGKLEECDMIYFRNRNTGAYIPRCRTHGRSWPCPEGALLEAGAEQLASDTRALLKERR